MGFCSKRPLARGANIDFLGLSVPLLKPPSLPISRSPLPVPPTSSLGRRYIWPAIGRGDEGRQCCRWITRSAKWMSSTSLPRTARLCLGEQFLFFFLHRFLFLFDIITCSSTLPMEAVMCGDNLWGWEVCHSFFSLYPGAYTKWLIRCTYIDWNFKHFHPLPRQIKIFVASNDSPLSSSSSFLIPRLNVNHDKSSDHLSALRQT